MCIGININCHMREIEIEIFGLNKRNKSFFFNIHVLCYLSVRLFIELIPKNSHSMNITILKIH